MRGESENMHDIAEIQWPGLGYHNMKIRDVSCRDRGITQNYHRVEGTRCKAHLRRHIDSCIDGSTLAQENYQHRSHALLLLLSFLYIYVNFQ